MQDGIIRGNGTSRYLKSIPSFLSQYPTYEDFAAALVRGDLPIDLNGINNSGWSQLPTMLNKASLLSDATASTLGNVTTPNEALNKLHNDDVANLNSVNAALGVLSTKLGTFCEIFTSNTTWIAPFDCVATVLCVGGGGGGSGGNGSGNAIGNGGNGGGGGNVVLKNNISISKNTSVAITIGTGGTGGSGGASGTTDISRYGGIGTTGGSTFFGSYLSASGGLGGAQNIDSNSQRGALYGGGIGTTALGGIGGAGLGAGGSATRYGYPGQLGTGYGSGGSGGGAGPANAVGREGGNGRPGIVILIYSAN